MIALDTNILVNLLVDDPSNPEQVAAARRAVAQQFAVYVPQILQVETELATTPVAKLGGKRLEAEDFDTLLSEDTVKDLLIWLNEPAGIHKTWPSAKWKAFQSRCKADCKFDPEKDGELVGAERLASRQDSWTVVWERFADSSAPYPGIPVLLRRAMPAHLDMFADLSPWPPHTMNKKSKSCA